MAPKQNEEQMLGVTRIRTKKQITLPDAVMKALGLEKGREIAFKLVNGTIYLEPVTRVTLPADEAYAFSPEWRRSIQRALAEIEVGHVYGPFTSGDEILKFARKIRDKGTLQ